MDSSNSSSHAIRSFDRRYYITVMDKWMLNTVTNNPHKIKAWIQSLEVDENEMYRHVGLGVVFDNTNVSCIKSIHLCCGFRCLVIPRIDEMSSCPSALEAFISSRKNLFVSTKIIWKMAQVQTSLHISVNSRKFDLGNAASKRFNNPQLLYADLDVLVPWILDEPRLTILKEDDLKYGSLEAFLSVQVAESLTTIQGLTDSIYRRRNGIELYRIQGKRNQIRYTVEVLGQEISTIVTKDSRAVAEWISEINAQGIPHLRYVGLDAEFQNDHVATLQLLVGGKCLVYRISNESSSPELNGLLTDDRNVFIGSNVELILDTLSKHYRLTTEGDVRFIDISSHSEKLKEKRLEILLHQALPMVDTDWGRSNDLSYQQVHFACLSCFLNLQFAKWLWN